MRKTLTAFLFLIYLGLAGAAEYSRPDESSRPSVALVLGGGAARGFAHIAVLELIEELDIPVDMIAGVSSGAIIGGLYASGYSPAVIMEIMEKQDWPSFFVDRPLSPFEKLNESFPLALKLGGSGESREQGSGYSSGQRAYELFKSLTVKIPSYTDFSKLPIPFKAGAVEIPGGRFELLDSGDLAEAIRASMSIPGVFEPFAIGEKNYVDGGLLNNLPIREVRELGYDIVIAVDLFAFPEEFSVQPLALSELMTTLYSNETSREHYAYADAVLFPLPAAVSTTDFGKGRDVYNMAKAERENLLSILKAVKEKLGDSGGRRGPEISYGTLPPFIPRRISLTGALRRDKGYIEREFTRLIKGRPLSEENVRAFLEKIYQTGSYLTALVRTDSRGEEACLEIILSPESSQTVFARAGLDYEGTLSAGTSARTALRGGVEFQNGKDFSILVEASVMDELSAGLSLMKPLGPHFFVSAETEIVRDQTLTAGGFPSGETPAADSLIYFRGALKGGSRLNRNNSLTLEPEYFHITDRDASCSVPGLTAAYTYSNVNYSLIPSRGIHGTVENRLKFNRDFSEVFNIINADLSAAVPLGGGFSIAASVFGSSLFGSSGSDAYEAPLDSAVFDRREAGRIYFPHAAGIFRGRNKTAFSFSLQFEPRENLSVLGGRLVFLLTGAAGRAGSFPWNEWNNPGENGIMWNASFGTALLPARTFGMILRAGAGGGGGLKPAPFVSFDFGMNRFQKGLF